MTKSQAKKLKAGDRVLWHGTDKYGIGGVVVRKHYNTVWIKWDDGVEQTQFAETMDNVWTADQLAAIEENNRVVEKVKEISKEKQLKQPYSW